MSLWESKSMILSSFVLCTRMLWTADVSAATMAKSLPTNPKTDSISSNFFFLFSPYYLIGLFSSDSDLCLILAFFRLSFIGSVKGFAALVWEVGEDVLGNKMVKAWFQVKVALRLFVRHWASNICLKPINQKVHLFFGPLFFFFFF